VPVPPKKETGKVQPKKETVRINLPPKPSAAPTIKLPTLPPGGPTGCRLGPDRTRRTGRCRAGSSCTARFGCARSPEARRYCRACARRPTPRRQPSCARRDGQQPGCRPRDCRDGGAGLVAVTAVVYLAFLYNIPPVQ
jgi:hypothetical protein